MTAVLDHFQYTSDCMSPCTLIRWVMFALHHWCPSLMWCWPAYSTCNLQNCSVKREFQGSKMHWYRDRTLGQSFRIIKACPIQKTGNFVNLCKGAIFKTDREWAVRSSVCTLLKTSKALQMDALKVQLSASSHAILTANKEHPWHSHNSSCSTENTYFCHQDWYMRIHNIVCRKPIVYSFPQLPRSCKNDFKWLRMLHFQPSNSKTHFKIDYPPSWTWWKLEVLPRMYAKNHLQ